jgi:SAM-dependent methyltransferase
MRLAGLRNWMGRGVPALADGLLSIRALAIFHARQPQGGTVGTTVQPPAAAAAAPAGASMVWPPERIEIVERLWGEGFLMPGSPAEIVDLAAPFGLSRATSVLLLGAGLGGAARALVEATDTWVTGFEADPALIAVATLRLKSCGGQVARRAMVMSWDPAAPSFKSRGFNHAMLFDVLAGQPPRTLLTAVAGALKPAGHLLMLQLVADKRLNAADTDLADWARAERRAPLVPTVEEISKILKALGFVARAPEDVSQHHAQLVIAGWSSLVPALHGASPGPAQGAAIIAEAERWMRRLRLIESGRLRLMLWHAVSPAVEAAPA